MPTRVLVFGDSISYGSWDPEGGWVDRLKRELHARSLASDFKDKYQFVNLGVGGHTTRDIAARAEHEIEARRSTGWDMAFILAVGVNDSRRPDGIALTELSAYLDQILAVFKRYSSRILIIGLTPIGQPRLDYKDTIYEQNIIDQYDQHIHDWTHTRQLPFVDTLALTRTNPQYIDSLTDGIHPGAAGHQILYEAVKTHLAKIISAQL